MGRDARNDEDDASPIHVVAASSQLGITGVADLASPDWLATGCPITPAPVSAVGGLSASPSQLTRAWRAAYVFPVVSIQDPPCAAHDLPHAADICIFRRGMGLVLRMLPYRGRRGRGL